MIGKRKLNTHTFCIDQKKDAIAPKKPPTKAEISNELKVVKKLNLALEEENKKYIDKIKGLEERVKALENQKSSSKVTTEKEYATSYCQTESEGIVFCYECEFPADDYHDLGEHMLEFHFLGSCHLCDESFTTKEKLEDHLIDDHNQKDHADRISENFDCNFCEQKFANKKDLMIHKKQKHLEMINTCWGFAAGTCVYGAEKCWFRHSISSSDEIKCKICNETFKSKPEYHKHKKEKHPSFVTRCNNALNGKCKYGVEFCWFNHKEDEEHEIVTNNYEVQTNEKNEVLERLFDIVEKNSERLKELEKRS